ncbi:MULTISPECIES: hypothetical protein [unclassified Sphingomonas]|uniref:hypothetical protein n=1 Tax=unclassified Sphingomonas TaxID=196159 RepID=UPI0006F9202B|nr:MULTISPECIES: hypothetical protein [unclassified Sphingomonas]KQM41842.1 hypothetical protein ASE57_16940 [Sphingomonas sp. Leaf11]
MTFWMGALALLASGTAQAQTCELHIWPSETYRGMKMSGLGMFGGALGGVIDQAANKGRVATITDRMHDDLSPEAQVEALRAADAAGMLGLTGYTIVVEPAVPSDAAAKADPAVGQALRTMQASLKAGRRLSDATTPCYAELVGGELFYVRKPLVGTNLFAKWTFRDFGRDGGVKPRSFPGQVKNPLAIFPAKMPDQVDAATADLRDAYARGFAEYVAKKVRGASHFPAEKNRTHRD